VRNLVRIILLRIVIRARIDRLTSHDLAYLTECGRPTKALEGASTPKRKGTEVPFLSHCKLKPVAALMLPIIACSKKHLRVHIPQILDDTPHHGDDIACVKASYRVLRLLGL